MKMVEWEWWRQNWGLYDAEKEAAAEAEAASEVIPVFPASRIRFPRAAVYESSSAHRLALGFGPPAPPRLRPPVSRPAVSPAPILCSSPSSPPPFRAVPC